MDRHFAYRKNFVILLFLSENMKMQVPITSHVSFLPLVILTAQPI